MTTTKKFLATLLTIALLLSSFAPTTARAASAPYCAVILQGQVGNLYYYEQSNGSFVISFSRSLWWSHDSHELRFSTSNEVLTSNLLTGSQPAYAEAGKYLVWQEPGDVLMVKLVGSKNAATKVENVRFISLDAENFVTKVAMTDGTERTVAALLATPAATAPTATATPSPTPVPTATPTLVVTPTPVPTVAPTATPAATPVATAAPTATPVATATPTVTPAATPVATVAPTTTPVVTVKNSNNFRQAVLYKYGDKRTLKIEKGSKKVTLDGAVIKTLSKNQYNKKKIRFSRIGFTQDEEIILVDNKRNFYRAKLSAPTVFTKIRIQYHWDSNGFFTYHT